MEVSQPPAMEAVHERLGTTPASGEDFAALADQMGAPDGEGSMPAAQGRLAVRFDELVWREAVRGFSHEPLRIAASARGEAERQPRRSAPELP